VNPTFDATHELAVAAPLPPLSEPSRPESVRIISKADDEVLRVEVDLSAPGILMQNDTFYPGWLATVDKRPATILPVDSIFRGVAVGVGHHTVTIAYRSKAVYSGIILSSFALFAIAVLFAVPLALSLRGRANAVGAPVAP
jgi:hypothetical protein